MFFLESDRLRIEITEPGEAPNTGFRFDRAGFVSEVTLDGTIRFAASEPKNLSHPCSGGRGFCSEYCLDVSGGAAVGEYFPRFGVGLIRKEDETAYLFHRAYRDVKDFPVQVEHDGRRAVFTTESVPCLGYAAKAVKTVSVEGDTMTVETCLRNTGEKDIHMEEYCHNFISIDGMAVGSDYRLLMPQIPDMGNKRLNNRRGFPGALRGDGHGYTFCEFTAIDTDTFVDGADIGSGIPFTWRLLHMGAGAYVEGKDYFVPGKVVVWGVDHMLCPEVTHCFCVEPGGSHSWKRTLRFGMLKRGEG